MARQDNPFALLGDDDEGADVSVLIAKVEAKKSVPPLEPAEHPKQKLHDLPSKLPAPADNVREEKGRGRGGRGPGRGGFGSVGGSEAIEQPYNGNYRGYSGESGGGRSRGRGGRGGAGRGRGFGFTGSMNRNQSDYDNLGEVAAEGAESQEKVYYGERRPFRYESRNFSEEKQGGDGEEKDDFGSRGYGGNRENWGFRGYGAGQENRGFRDGEDHGGRNYGGDRENRGFRGGEGYGRGYGGRGRRGGRDGEHGGAHQESNGRLNVFESKDNTIDAKEPIAINTIDGDGGFGSVDPPSVEEPKNEQHEKPKNEQHEKPIPEQISTEDTSKGIEEDNEMTLAEYEKLLQEKRKALESLKVESRKVVLDKDFEGMQIIEKKKEQDLIKMKSDNDKGKKKEIAERDDKSRKSLNINEFLKPADGERYRGPASSRGRGGGRGRGRGGYTTDYQNQVAAPPLEDPSHFPVLAPVAKV
ncbi:hypothetical protein KSP40_PGU020018 [Platanthera guangdongensis]|uniref:Hyaluronan/mRNA-binding protein domain-containing protein n=1 Tax=Platanthera guangdongensis TaxID=2320717 RepID=A0ABR2MEV2_9ASPA